MDVWDELLAMAYDDWWGWDLPESNPRPFEERKKRRDGKQSLEPKETKREKGGWWVPVVVDSVLRETAKALLVLLQDEEVWLPRSQIRQSESYGVGDGPFEMELSRFIIQEKGIDVFEE